MKQVVRFNVLQDSGYGRVWHRARAIAFSPEQGVQVLMRVYAGWIQDQYGGAETAIGDAFEGDDDTPLAS